MAWSTHLRIIYQNTNKVTRLNEMLQLNFMHKYRLYDNHSRRSLIVLKINSYVQFRKSRKMTRLKYFDKFLN